MKHVISQREDVFLLRTFLDSSECQGWIARSELAGYEKAKITGVRGEVVVEAVRNNDRLIWDDPELASAWWQRAAPHIPASFGRWRAIGFNERFRFYRYGPGQRFAPHRDGSFQRNADEISWMTFLVYLNSDFAGGHTRFDLAGEPAPVVVEPEQGTALVFMHDRLHAGEEVTHGTKYVLRTDVMYRRP